jgi:uncharacterized protein (DUF3084 family)
LDNLKSATDNQKAETPNGSSGNDAETSNETSAFTADDVKKLINDALAKAGRDAKSLASKEAEILARNEKLAAIESELNGKQREIDLREIEAVKDDPLAVKTIEYRQKLAEREKEISRREKEIRQREEAIQSTNNEIKSIKFRGEIKRISDAYGVSEDLLTGLGIDDTDKIESIAKLMPGQSKVKVDSGKTTGGQVFTREQIANREFWKEHKDDIIKAQKEGRIK